MTRIAPLAFAALALLAAAAVRAQEGQGVSALPPGAATLQPPPPPAPAPAEPHSSPLSNLRVSVTAGYGWAFGHNYLELGAGVGYRLVLNLEVGLDVTWWTGATPSLGKLGPRLTWYLPLPVVNPYIGAFYTHWFVGSGFQDSDAVGGRVGLTLASAGPASVQAGVAYERVLGCDTDRCDSYWPEVSAGISF
jgi:hypothetical protein